MCGGVKFIVGDQIFFQSIRLDVGNVKRCLKKSLEPSKWSQIGPKVEWFEILAQTGDTFLVITRAREVESSSAAHRVKEGTELLRTNPYPVTLAKAVI